MNRCSVGGCDRPYYAKGLCHPHYDRQRKYGDPEYKKAPRTCSVDGCSGPLEAKGLCKKHYMRVKRRGTLELLPNFFGENNPNWRGDNIRSYRTAHDRVRRVRGPANGYQCVDCGQSAEEWSYVGGCSRELIGQHGGCTVSYSPDPDRYVPRCIRCHRIYDDCGKNLKGAG